MGSISSKPVSTCSICLDTMNKELKTLDCGHSFHNSCVSTWFQHKTSCPLCRKDQNQDEHYVTLRVTWTQVGDLWTRNVIVLNSPFTWRPADGPMPPALEAWIADR